MPTAGSFRRRRLGRELQQLRRDLGMKTEDAAAAADISQPTLSRIERAAVEIKPTTVRALLDVYGVTGERRDALLALAREAKKQGWWHVYGDVLPEWFEVYVSLEEEADLLCTYDALLINGLMQTEDYARALLTASRPGDAPEDIDRLVQLRMQRQRRVTDGELRLHAIIDECALHRLYGGPAAMSRQFRHLIEIAELRNVSLQILPAGSPPGTTGVFSIFEFGPDDPTVAYLENEIGALYLEKPQQVRPYSRLYDRLRAAALGPEATVHHLAKLEE